MKTSLVTTLLALIVAVASVRADSAIQLSNVGVGGIVSGTDDAPLGRPGLTTGVYYAIGDVAAAVNGVIGGATTRLNRNDGTLAGSGLTLGTGAGSTAVLGAPQWGQYDSTTPYVIPGASGDTLVTLVLVAYFGASYESAGTLGRGHSAAFTMTAVGSPGSPLFTGAYSGEFTVVPEPSPCALTGLGLASLMIFRRRKQASF